MAYMTLGTFDNGAADPGLGIRIGRKKKKAPARVPVALGPTIRIGTAPKKKKKKKSLLRRIGKAALKVAPVAAGLLLPGAGAIAVGAVSGAVGRGKPKLKRILRGAAIAGGTSLVKGAIKSGQAGRILVKGKNALGGALRAGGKVVGKVGSGAGHIIENIAKGDIGPAEGAAIGAGGGALVMAAKKLLKGRDSAGEPVVPDESPITAPGPTDEGQVPSGPGPGPVEIPESGPVPPSPLAPPSPVETPTAGTIPTAGGEVPSTATGAMFPGAGGESFAPAAAMTAEEDAAATEEGDDQKKKLLLAGAVVVGVLILANAKKRRRT